MDEIKQFLKTRKKANLIIVIINIVVFVVLSIMGDTTDGQFMVDHGAAFTPYILAGDYYRLFTDVYKRQTLQRTGSACAAGDGRRISSDWDHFPCDRVKTGDRRPADRIQRRTGQPCEMADQLEIIIVNKNKRRMLWKI